MEPRRPAAPAVEGEERCLDRGDRELRPDQRVDALVRQPRGDRNAQADHGGDDLDQAQPLEEKLPLQEHLELLAQRRDEKDEARPPHEIHELRLVKEARRERRDNDHDDEQAGAGEEVGPVQARQNLA